MAASQPLISHVSDTARWVAVYRGVESARSDAVFSDPLAADDCRAGIRLVGGAAPAPIATVDAPVGVDAPTRPAPPGQQPVERGGPAYPCLS